MALAQRAEALFEAWGRLVVAHPLRTLVITLLAAFGLSYPLPEIRFETDPESFLEEDDPALLA